MNKNTSVVGVTTLISQTPHETGLEKINTIFFPKISAENVEKERQERSKQLQKIKNSLLENFVQMVVYIFNINIPCWDEAEKVAKLCASFSVEELIAFEKSFPRHPVIKPIIGFFPRCSCWYWWHFFRCNKSECKCRIFEIVEEYFYCRKELIRYGYGGEKAVWETLKEWSTLVVDHCRKRDIESAKKGFIR